jgi:hypothetical protein
MTVGVTVAGSASYSIGSAFNLPTPSAWPVQATVANTPGDWMAAIVTWRQPQGASAATSTVPIGVFRGRMGQYVSSGNSAVLTAVSGFPPTPGVPLSSIQAYEGFIGRQVTYVLDFMAEAPATWTQFETGVVGTISGTNVPLAGWGSIGSRQMLLGVPACAGASTGSGGATWAAEAAGTNDAHWTALGNYLIAHGYGSACLRIAREFNGTWYPWEVTASGSNSSANFIAGWQHIVTLLRALSGADFTFCWNPYLGGGGSGISPDVTAAYPGDSYVDFIGLDVYDGGNGYPAEGMPYTRTLSAQEAKYANQQTETNGLAAWKAFAASHSKPLCFPEWGLTLWNNTGSIYTGGGDDPYFIGRMAEDYIAGAGFHALWEHYDNGVFDPDADAGRNGLTVANSRAVFLDYFAAQTSLPGGQAVTVSVADDAHNFWEPLGAPSGDSDPAGVTRTAIWYAPAARAAKYVQACATGTIIALAVTVLDISGLSKWVSLTELTTGSANSATALSAGIDAPPAQALMLAALGTDNNSATIGGPGTGWTSLAAVTSSNGVDHTADIALNSAWRVATVAETAAWTSTASLDMSAVTAGLLVTATAPAQANPDWPVVVTELAIGAGAFTPPSELSWTEITPRSLSMNFTQGRQYTAGQLQAGQGTLIIDNPDGAVIPPGSGAFAGIDSGTPVRQRVVWPASATPYYVPFSGFFQRWPFNIEDGMLRGQAQATIQDVWAYAAGTLDSMVREEYLLDAPYALWPMDDAAGATSAANLATGNSSPLALITSKYGSGGGTATFGSSTGALLGDSSAQITSSGQAGGAAGVFNQVLGTPGNAQEGSALSCTDTGYPPVSGGVTIEVWAGVNSGTEYGFTAATSGSLFSVAGTSFSNGQPVYLTVASGFTLPGGFSAGVLYYVISASGSTFQLSASSGGSAITVTSAGAGFITTTTASHTTVLSARNFKGVVVELDVSNITGALTMSYNTASGSFQTVTIDSSRDYRENNSVVQFALIFSTTSYQVITEGGLWASVTGTFASAIPAAFTEVTFGGIADRALQGGFINGSMAMAAVFGSQLPAVRIVNHFWAGNSGVEGEFAYERIERILEYAGLTGRRCILGESVIDEGDRAASGQDVGGQPAATSITNVAASTLPGLFFVAPTGDLFYLNKWMAWNQPVKWTLGDNVAGGEIPFTPQDFATDYDPTRVVNDIQLTQLDTSAVTVPAGSTATTTMGAIEAASRDQYGDQPYQQTGYLENDATSNYNVGAGLGDLANWLANVFAKPQNRIQAVKIAAHANAANVSTGAAWQFWAGASTGDMVAVNVRLPTAATSPLISLVARITQTTRNEQFSQDGTDASISCVLDFAPEYDCLTCDDATRGLLNGANRIGW